MRPYFYPSSVASAASGRLATGMCDANLLFLPVQPFGHDRDGAPFVGGLHEDREAGTSAGAVEDRRLGVDEIALVRFPTLFGELLREFIRQGLDAGGAL